jgi:hypothetical protein
MVVGTDRQGEFVAKTEGGQLKFYNKRQRVGKKTLSKPKRKKQLLLLDIKIQRLLNKLLNNRHQ